MQNQMHLKKATHTPKSRELSLKNKAVLAPVMDFKKNKKEDDDKFSFSAKVRNLDTNTKILYWLDTIYTWNEIMKHK